MTTRGRNIVEGGGVGAVIVDGNLGFHADMLGATLGMRVDPLENPVVTTILASDFQRCSKVALEIDKTAKTQATNKSQTNTKTGHANTGAEKLVSHHSLKETFLSFLSLFERLQNLGMSRRSASHSVCIGAFEDGIVNEVSFDNG
jgi:hypothetical protein